MAVMILLVVNTPPTLDGDEERDPESTLQKVINTKVDDLRHLRSEFWSSRRRLCICSLLETIQLQLVIHWLVLLIRFQARPLWSRLLVGKGKQAKPAFHMCLV
jgi:hypothetical protein